MRYFLLLLFVLATWVGAFGQARTAEQIVSVPFSQLSIGNPPNGAVRHVINGTPGTTPCTGGGTGALAIKLAGVWQCPRVSASAGTGDVSGPASSNAGALAVFSNTSGKNLTPSTITGFMLAVSGVPTGVPSTGTDNVVLSSGATLSNPTLLNPTIGVFTNAQHGHSSTVTGGQLNASNVFVSGTVPPARIISNALTLNKCLRLSSGGAIETAAEDCGSGGGSTPGGVNGNLLVNEAGSIGGASNSAYESITGVLTLSQKANGNDTLVGLRFTDSTPTGSFLKFRNAAASTDLFAVNVDGSLSLTNQVTLKTIAAPALPAAGNTVVWTDLTDKNLKAQDDAGNVSITLRPIACSGTDKISSISSAGVVTCTADQGGAGTGVITLNTLSTSDQNFVAVDDANIDLTISSNTSTHTFTVAWLSTLSKARQHDATMYVDQGNTITTGAQSYAAATSLTIPSSAGAAPTASGQIAFDTTSNTGEMGVNGTNRTIAFTAGSQTFTDKTLDNSTTANLRDTLLTLQDNADPTKTVNFELSGITTGTNRIVSIANAASTTVQPSTATTNQFVTHIDSAGVTQKAQPSFANLSGTMGETQGGTGQTSYAQGDILFASAANTLSRLPKSTTATHYLANTGASNSPQWGPVDLASGVSGLLPFASLSGSATDAQIPNSITIDLATLATTAGAGDSATAFFSSGVLETAIGGTGLSTPGTSGNVLQSNGTIWTSSAVDFTELTGSATDAQIPNSITVDLATLATTATTANAGDSATAFFPVGTIEAARLPDLSGLNGAVTDAQVPNTITIDLATVATTANAGDSATAFFSAGTIEAVRLPDLSGLNGAVTDAQVPNTITIDLATVATTANSGDSATAFFSTGIVEAARLGSGTPNSTNFLRGDGSWVTPSGSGDMVLAGAQSNTGAKTFTDGTLILNGGDYGAADGSMPAGVEKSFFLNTNASSRHLFIYNDGQYRQIFQAGIDAINLASANVSGVLPLANGGTNQATWTASRCVQVNSAGTALESAAAACGSGGGGGTVTVVSSGSLTSTALVTGGGSQTLQTPSATSTLDSSGNMSLPGSLTLAGSGAGYLELAEGTAPTVVANRLTFAAPADAPAAGLLYILPSDTPTNGEQLTANISGTTVTLSWDAAGSGGSGDAITVNSSAATDANFIDTAASGTVPSITWSLNTGATPDAVSISAIGVASTTEAGVITTGTQSLAGAKLLGHTAALGRLAQTFEITTSANFGGAALNTFSTTAGEAGVLDFNRSKSATKGTQTAVAAEDQLGFITFRGSDGTSFQNAASIQALVDGTPSSGDMPGRLSFWTTPDASATLVERWRITNAGHILAVADNVYDVGGTGPNKPRNVYVGTSVLTPLITWTGSVQDNSGSGSPEGVVTAAIGSVYRRTDGGASTTLYVKESGAGNTGWVAYGAAGGSGAPTDATYITQTANGTLSAEQALSALSTGIMRVATTTGVVTSLTDSAGIFANISDESGSGSLLGGTSPTITTPSISGAITFPDNVRQTFNPGANAAGLNVGALAGDPDTPSNGDLWYDSVADELTARINGANVALGAGGGGGANTALSNLASVAINTSLVSDTDNTDDLGSSSVRWKDVFAMSLDLGGSGAGYLELAEGSAPTVVANRFQIFAPADVAAGGLSFILPAAGATGFLKTTNSSGAMTLSIDTTSYAPLVSPSFTTPALGVATATSINGLTITTSTGTLTIANGKTATVSNSITFAGTDATVMTFPSTSGSVLTADSTKTLTNATFDTAGTGNLFTSSFVVDAPAAGCSGTTASSFWDLPTTTPAVAACVTGTNTQKAYLDFADTTGGFSAQYNFRLAADFTGTIDASITWLTPATSGNVEWSLSTICVATDATETDDPAFNTASTVVTAAPGVANRVQTSTITSVTITGCLAGEWIYARIFRDGNDAQDTISNTARLKGVQFVLRRSQ